MKRKNLALGILILIGVGVCFGVSMGVSMGVSIPLIIDMSLSSRQFELRIRDRP